MRKYLIAGNWKMHGSQSMTAELISGIANALKSHTDNKHSIQILVCPPAPFLAQANLVSEKYPGISIGAQNVNEHEQGAYTGEISISMLAELGCEYVLLGHSERRELFAESDADVAEKFAACISHSSNIVPVLCIGETLSQRQSGETETVVGQQIDAVLQKVGIQGFANAVIAYEPVWAIGTGETATPEQAQQVHKYIRQKLAQLDSEIADSLQILYGGSMKADNAKDLLSQNDIDGGLIGGASLKADSFAAICKAAIALN